MPSMKRTRYLAFFGFLTIFLLNLPLHLLAQPGDPGCDPLCNCRADGSYCPIDSGLVWLLAIGVLYGFFRYWRQKNSRHSTT